MQEEIKNYKSINLILNNFVCLHKVAAIQHSIVLPTNDPILEQKEKIFEKIEKMIKKAATLGANIVCLPETWSK